MEKGKIDMEKSYCGLCGRELIMAIVGAEQVGESRYSEKTGKRCYAIKYQCPNYKWYFVFSGHQVYYKTLSDEEAERIIIK